MHGNLEICYIYDDSTVKIPDLKKNVKVESANLYLRFNRDQKVNL